MRFVRSLGVAVALTLASLSPALAAPHDNSHSRARNQTIVRTFRLQVTGPVDSRATFWVAYGPLEGRWGLVQLHPIGAGMYGAAQRLPAHGRTGFAYIEGNGTVHTRLGLVPGDPIVTIKRFDNVSVAASRLDLIRWQPPVG